MMLPFGAQMLNTMFDSVALLVQCFNREKSCWRLIRIGCSKHGNHNCWSTYRIHDELEASAHCYSCGATNALGGILPNEALCRRKQQIIFEEASQVANDAIRGIRTVTSFSAENKVLEMYKEKCKAPKKLVVWDGIVGGVSLGFANFVFFSICAFSFYIGAILTNQGHANFSEVFKVFFARQVCTLGIA